VALSSRQAIDRRLQWDGCFNVRDLGGLTTERGTQTRWGAVVRSDARERLTEAGWGELLRHNVTTIIDLRDESELDAAFKPPKQIKLVHQPVLDLSDDEFWGDGRWRGRDHSSAFYVAVLERWPERFAAAVTGVARARTGTVLIHCQAGRDRTGLLAACLLSLAGVEAESIAEDYSRSQECLQPLYDKWISEAAHEQERERIRLANSSEIAVMREVLARVDISALLCENGLSGSDVVRVRARLLPLGDALNRVWSEYKRDG
jgi:protein-tyrosine phosphatase